MFSRFWPVIDTQLRQLAIDKRISVKLLISNWAHSNKAMKPFLKSLSDITNAYPRVDIQVVSRLNNLVDFKKIIFDFP